MNRPACACCHTHADRRMNGDIFLGRDTDLQVIRGISYQQSVFSRQLNLANDTAWRYQFTHIRLFVGAVRALTSRNIIVRKNPQCLSLRGSTAAKLYPSRDRWRRWGFFRVNPFSNVVLDSLRCRQGNIVRILHCGSSRKSSPAAFERRPSFSPFFLGDARKRSRE